MDNKTKIQSYNKAKLIKLWEGIQSNDTPDWLPGIALEYLIIRAFEIERAKVRYP